MEGSDITSGHEDRGQRAMAANADRAAVIRYSGGKLLAMVESGLCSQDLETNPNGIGIKWFRYVLSTTYVGRTK